MIFYRLPKVMTRIEIKKNRVLIKKPSLKLIFFKLNLLYKGIK